MKNQQTLQSLLSQLNDLGLKQKLDSNILHEEIRTFMQKLRDDLGETAASFAKRAGGVKPHYIYMIESGSRRWSAEMLQAIIESMN